MVYPDVLALWLDQRGDKTWRGPADEAEFAREFPTLPRVEGIAITDDGRFFYVTDEDESAHLRLTRLLAG